MLSDRVHRIKTSAPLQTDTVDRLKTVENLQSDIKTSSYAFLLQLCRDDVFLIQINHERIINYVRLYKKITRLPPP